MLYIHLHSLDIFYQNRYYLNFTQNESSLGYAM